MNESPKVMGRPTVVTPEVLLKLEQAFALDATVAEACSYANISQSTFFKYQKENPDFSERVADLRNMPILKARETVIKKLSESYPYAMDYLQRKRRDEFAPSQKVEVEGRINITHVLNNIEVHGQKIIGQRVENETSLLNTGQEQPTYQVLPQQGADTLQPE